MSGVIKNPRNGCALHGALQTVQEIRGVVPIIHANAGCGVINYLSALSTGEGRVLTGGYNAPGTTVQERHVIFGGASRLREQIKNTIKIVNGDLYVILNSCESAMVGDDVEAMTREIVEQGEPVVNTLVAGFNGGAHYGYEHVLADILRSVYEVKKNERKTDETLVNIFGIIPWKDPFWKGNLDEISKILKEVGLRANVFFGDNGGVEDLIKAQNAKLSIVFGRWGELPASVLETKFGIPKLLFPTLPADYKDEKELIEKISELVSVNKEKAEQFFAKEKKYEENYRARILTDLLDYDIGKDAAIVGDEETVIRVAKLLKSTFGTEIRSVVLTDVLKHDEDHLADYTDDIEGIVSKVYISSDQKEIEEILKASKTEFIIGSSFEKAFAEKRGNAALDISFPIYDRTILNKTTIGTVGEIGLIEDIVYAVKKYEWNRKNNLVAYIRNY